MSTQRGLAPELFAALDLDGDGKLSRDELQAAARQLGWHWPQARLYAVLDRLTLHKPLSRKAFLASLASMAQDPLGPFGRVLLRAWSPTVPQSGDRRRPSERDEQREPDEGDGPLAHQSTGAAQDQLAHLLAQSGEPEAADDYRELAELAADALEPLAIHSGAMLVIDPQRSFTRGCWAQSLGPDGAREIQPIRLAFESCARLLQNRHPLPETMFTRCPFPPDSYDWDEPLTSVLPRDQCYFVKPGNSVLWPPTNGFERWANRQLDDGKTTLVMGGCTLNSCVRVSAIETQKLLGSRGLHVVVDLSLAGARLGNYVRSAQFGGRSSVQAAVTEMGDAGVTVTAQVQWQH